MDPLKESGFSMKVQMLLLRQSKTSCTIQQLATLNQETSLISYTGQA